MEKIRRLEENYISELPASLFPSVLGSSLNLAFRISICFYLSNKLGFIAGLISTLFIFFVFKYIVFFAFKLESTSMQDRIFINKYFVYGINIAGVLELEDFDVEEVRRNLIEKFFKRHPKLSAKLTTFLSDFYWTTPQVPSLSEKEKEELRSKRIKVVTLENENQIRDYLEQVINLALNPFETPLEFHIIKYTNNSDPNDKSKKGSLLFLFDHCLSDGLGAISLTGFLDKEFSIEKYPAIMRKKIGGLWYYFTVLIDIIKAIIIGIIPLFYFLSYSISKESLRYKGFLSKKDGKHSGIALLSQVASFELDKVKKVSKKHQISINDLIVYAVLKSFKILSPESNQITVLIPVGLTNLPKKIEEVQLYNKASGYVDSIKLPELEGKANGIDEGISMKNKNKFKLIDTVSNMYKSRTLQIMNYLLGEFYHFYLLKAHQANAYPEIAISNVPTQEKFIYVGKCKVTKIYPVSNCGALNAFTAIVSYSGQLHIQFAVEKNTGINPDYLREIFLTNLEALIADKNKKE